ncbi:IS110 family transposase, partial [Lactobacillus crispatus]
EYLALQRLTRARYEITSSLTRAKQHFIETLYYRVNKLVTVDKDNIKTSIFGATMLSIVTDSKTIDEIAEMPIEDLIDYLQTKGRGRFSDPETLAKAIRKAVRGSYRLGKVMKDSIDAVLSVYYAEIKTNQKLIKNLDKAITDIVQTLPEERILQSIPGIGSVYSAGIIAEIGSIDRFDTEAQLAKYAGLAWRQKQSSNFDSEHKPMTKNGNHYLRYYLVEAANLIRQRDPVFRKYYQKKYDEAFYSPHKRACVLCARKLTRTIFTLLKNGQIYQTPR